VADVTVLYIDTDGNLAQIQDGDNLLADNLTRKSSSGNLTIGANVTGGGEDVVIGSALSATGEVLLGSVSSQARALGDLVADGLLSTPIVEVSGGGEVRFWDVGDSNYVGFEAPALTANQIWILPATDGTAGQVLSTSGGGAGVLSWVTVGGGGDVTGPSSSLDNQIARFNSTTGKIIQAGTNAPTYTDAGALVSKNHIGYDAEYNQGSAGANLPVSFDEYQLIRATLTANCAVTLDAPPVIGHYQLKILTNASTPGYTVTFNTVVRWAGGTTYVATTAVNRVDFINLYWDGSTWWGQYSKNFPTS